MIVAASKTYKLEYDGETYSIPRDRLIGITDRLATSWRGSTPERKRKLAETILKLNWKYMTNCPFRFACQMERDEWVANVLFRLPAALDNYEPDKGHFHTYFASWKHAANSLYQDQKESVRMPQNQRLTRAKLLRKAFEAETSRGEELTDAEEEYLEKVRLVVLSMGDRAGAAPEVSFEDILVGEDLREKELLDLNEIWRKIRSVLEPKEFLVFMRPRSFSHLRLPSKS